MGELENFHDVRRAFRARDRAAAAAGAAAASEGWSPVGEIDPLTGVFRPHNDDWAAMQRAGWTPIERFQSRI